MRSRTIKNERKSMKLPTKRECLDLLKEYRLPQNVIAHSKAVNALSVFLTEKLKKSGINVNADLTLFQQEKSNNLQPFLVTIEPMRLGKIYDISRAIVNELVKDPETVCLSCLVELAEQNNLKIAVNMIGEKKVLFTIKDYTTDIEEPYVFRFVAQLK